MFAKKPSTLRIALMLLFGCLSVASSALLVAGSYSLLEWPKNFTASLSAAAVVFAALGMLFAWLSGEASARPAASAQPSALTPSSGRRRAEPAPITAGLAIIKPGTRQAPRGRRRIEVPAAPPRTSTAMRSSVVRRIPPVPAIRPGREKPRGRRSAAAAPVSFA